MFEQMMVSSGRLPSISRSAPNRSVQSSRLNRLGLLAEHCEGNHAKVWIAMLRSPALPATSFLTAFKQTLEREDDDILGLSWAVFAMEAIFPVLRAAHSNMNASVRDAIVEAALDVLSIAWTAMPPHFINGHAHRDQIRSLSDADPACRYSRATTSLFRILSECSAPIPPAAWPILVWNSCGAIGNVPLAEQSLYAKTGLLPDVLIGHRQVWDGLTSGQSWPVEDPHLPALLLQMEKIGNPLASRMSSDMLNAAVSQPQRPPMPSFRL
jgi:hypothetical protein